MPSWGSSRTPVQLRSPPPFSRSPVTCLECRRACVSSRRPGIRSSVALASSIALVACGHASPPPGALATTSTLVRVSSSPSFSESAGTSGWPYPPATFSSAETGRILLRGIGGNAWICRTTRLYVGLANDVDEPKLTRLIDEHRKIAHVHIDDPSSGHMVYDLYGVTVTGKSMPPASALVTFTLRFDTLDVTGCNRPPGPFSRGSP
jgi:hypothetical protein